MITIKNIHFSFLIGLLFLGSTAKATDLRGPFDPKEALENAVSFAKCETIFSMESGAESPPSNLPENLRVFVMPNFFKQGDSFVDSLFVVSDLKTNKEHYYMSLDKYPKLIWKEFLIESSLDIVNLQVTALSEKGYSAKGIFNDAILFSLNKTKKATAQFESNSILSMSNDVYLVHCDYNLEKNLLKETVFSESLLKRVRELKESEY